MSGPKELAEKAFELFQDALRAAESRAEELAELVEAERAKAARLERELELEAADRGPGTPTRTPASLVDGPPTAESSVEQSAPEEGARESDAADAAAARMREQLAERDARIVTLYAQVEQLSAERTRLDGELSAANARAEERDSALQASQDALERAREETTRLVTRQAELETAMSEAREQVARLEAELKEEKECTENLSELANERREQLTKVEEKLEEAEERYEDARWRLGKAAHFERLVKRRRKLIRSLIASLRAKHKSNTALKAGLDALRTYKAGAEANQQRLLSRIDSLKTALGRAEEAVAQQHGATLAREQLAEAESRALQLEQRLASQAEVLRSLEDELRTVKAFQQPKDGLDAELGDLRRELEAKNALIDTLQKEADAAARELARLRRRNPAALETENGEEQKSHVG